MHRRDFFANMGSRAITAATVELNGCWTVLDGILARVPYVAGPAFTLADIALGVHVHRWFSFDLTRPPQPHPGAGPWLGIGREQ